METQSNNKYLKKDNKQALKLSQTKISQNLLHTSNNPSLSTELKTRIESKLGTYSREPKQGTQVISKTINVHSAAKSATLCKTLDRATAKRMCTSQTSTKLTQHTPIW